MRLGGYQSQLLGHINTEPAGCGNQLIAEPLRIMIFTGAAMSGPFMYDRCGHLSCGMIGNKQRIFS